MSKRHGGFIAAALIPTVGHLHVMKTNSGKKSFGPNALLSLQCNNSCNPQGAPLGTELFPNSLSPQSLREQCLQQLNSNLSQKRGPQRVNILFFISTLSSFDDELEPKHSFSHSSSYTLF